MGVKLGTRGLAAITLAAAFLLTLHPAPTRGQVQFEIVRLGQFPERVIRNVTDAASASLQHLVEIGAPLQGVFRIVLHDNSDRFKDALIARGLRGPWWPTGQPFPDNSFHLDMTRIRESDIPWFVSHETFHLAQWQLLGVAGETHVNHPRNRGHSFFMMEGAAEVFKLKTLERMGITRYSAQVRGLLSRVSTLPSECRIEPTAGWTRWYGLINLPQCGSRPLYDQAALMAAYLFDQHGGWPRIVAYFRAGDIPSAATRFSTVYGLTLEDFEREFSAFLGR